MPRPFRKGIACHSSMQTHHFSPESFVDLNNDNNIRAWFLDITKIETLIGLFNEVFFSALFFVKLIKKINSPMALLNKTGLMLFKLQGLNLRLLILSPEVARANMI